MKALASSVLVLLSLTVFTGCAATEEDADEGGNAISGPAASARATIKSSSIDKTQDRCTSKGSEIQVSGIAKAAATKINDALSSNRTSEFAMADCSSEPLLWESTQKAHINAKGYLSIEENGKVLIGEDESSAATFARGYNFDLATGKRLYLKEILTTAGLELAIDGCDEALRILQGVGDGFVAQCTATIRNEENAPANVVAEKEGLRIFPSLDDYNTGKTSALVAWSVVEPQLTKVGKALRASAK